MQSLSIDMDEVITDTAGRLRECYQRDYGIEIQASDLYGKSMREAVNPDHCSCFSGYLNAPGFFSDLDIMCDAENVLKRLNEKYELYIVSAATEFPNSLLDKLNWITERLPFITWRQVCLCGSKSIIQTDIMIDDRTRNFSNFNGRKILYTSHHNVLETGYERVANWQEIAAKLL
jgi:5'-nucleotidase